MQSKVGRNAHKAEGNDSMKYAFILILLYLQQISKIVSGSDCHETLSNNQIKFMDWLNLKHCLLELSDRDVSKNTSENIWRLVKIAFDGVQNIPPEAYANLGSALTAIPKHDLRNISMERVEIVAAFGAIGKRGAQIKISTTTTAASTFNDEQMRIIAQKVRTEWLGKTPKTYSEYDLISLGQIICHLNVTDIAQIHPDAFRYAVEWIGNLQNCPQKSLEAFAALAVHEEAFGKPQKWSKIDLSIIGNILNGLSKSDIDSIDESKLYLNHYYIKPNRTSRTTAKRERERVATTTVSEVPKELNATSMHTIE